MLYHKYFLAVTACVRVCGCVADALSMDLVVYIAARSWKMKELAPSDKTSDGLTTWSKASSLSSSSCPGRQHELWQSSAMARPLPQAGLEDVSCGITLHEVESQIAFVSPPCLRLSYHWACALTKSEFAAGDSETELAVGGPLDFFLLHHIRKPDDFLDNYAAFVSRHSGDDTVEKQKAKNLRVNRGKIVKKGMVSDGSSHSVTIKYQTAKDAGEAVPRTEVLLKLNQLSLSWSPANSKGKVAT